MEKLKNSLYSKLKTNLYVDIKPSHRDDKKSLPVIKSELSKYGTNLNKSYTSARLDKSGLKSSLTKTRNNTTSKSNNTKINDLSTSVNQSDKKSLYVTVNNFF